jgi:hypothetical protein
MQAIASKYKHSQLNVCLHIKFPRLEALDLDILNDLPSNRDPLHTQGGHPQHCGRK